MATVYRTALVVALEEFFGRVQIFCNADAGQILPERMAERALDQVVASMVRNRGLN